MVKTGSSAGLFLIPLCLNYWLSPVSPTPLGPNTEAYPWRPGSASPSPVLRERSSFDVLRQRASETSNFSTGQGFENRRGVRIRAEYDLSGGSISKSAQQENSNVFIFCLMFLFGLIMAGLIWCLCVASRNLDLDSGARPGGNSWRSMNSRFSRGSGSRAGAHIHAILPDTTDLPPAYNEIFSDYDKMGSQCILPSYKEIMSQQSPRASNKDLPSVAR